MPEERRGGEGETGKIEIRATFNQMRAIQAKSIDDVRKDQISIVSIFLIPISPKFLKKTVSNAK